MFIVQVNGKTLRENIDCFWDDVPNGVEKVGVVMPYNKGEDVFMLPDQVDWYAFFNEGVGFVGGGHRLVAKHVAYGIGDQGTMYRIEAGTGLMTERCVNKQELGSTVRYSKFHQKVMR